MRLALLSALVLPLALVAAARARPLPGNDAATPGDRTERPNSAAEEAPRQSAAAPPVRTLWIDTDLSFYSDDAVAIQMLLRNPHFTVAGISAASGNVWSDQAAADALRALQDGGFANVRVHPGLPPAAWAKRLELFRSGLDRAPNERVVYAGALALNPVQPPLAPPGGWAAKSTSPPAAPEALQLAARSLSGKLEIVLLGPATHLAHALASDPGLVKRIAHIYFFAGALEAPGNATRSAEFNAWFDPEAADAVLRSGIPLTLMPLDVTQGLRYDPAWAARYCASRNPLAAHVSAHIAHHQAGRGSPPSLYDEVLAALILDPSLATGSMHQPVEVVNRPGADFGRTRLAHDGRPPVRIIHGVDRARLFARLESALAERP